MTTEVTRKVAWINGEDLRMAERLAVRSRGFVEIGQTYWPDGEVDGRYPFAFESYYEAKRFAAAVELASDVSDDWMTRRRR